MIVFGINFTATQVYLLGICGTLILVLIGFHVTDTLNRKNRFRMASDKFTSAVLNELIGIVPVEGFWNQEIYIRIKATTHNIQRAAIEFYPSIPFLRRNRFNKAVMEYCKQSENINWNQAILDAADETDFEETQKGKFVKCVESLLSFTN